MTRSLSIAVLIAVFSASAWGAASARIVVQQTQVRVNVPFALELEITGGRLDSWSLPAVDGLHIDSTPVQQSQQFSLVNGVMSQAWIFVYGAKATRPGKIIIPAMKLSVGGVPVTTNSVELTAVAIGAALPPAPAPAPQNPSPAPTPAPDTGNQNAPTVDDAVLIRTKANKTTVYQGEQIILTLSRWILRGVQAGQYRSSVPGYPTTEGFYATEYETHRENQFRKGWPYHVVQLVQKLYPTRSGTLTIGAWHWNGQATIETTSGRIFNQDYSLSTKPITITVKPLPARPADFSGAVGSFSLRADFPDTPDPQIAQQGVPLKMVVAVHGMGNPDAISQPEMASVKGVTISQPEVDPNAKVDSSGAVTKDFTYTVLPLRKGKVTLPAIKFCYFDPEAERYKTDTVSPFEMDVRPSMEKGGGVVVTSVTPEANGAVHVIGEDIMANVEAPLSLRPYGPSALGTSAVAVAPVLAYAGLALVMARRRRFERDTGYARAYFAKSKAHKRLHSVATAAEPAEELYRAIMGFVADKFDVGDAGMTSTDLGQLLQRHGIGAELAESLIKITRACERARYASVKLSADEIAALTHAASGSLDQLESVAKETRA